MPIPPHRMLLYITLSALLPLAYFAVDTFISLEKLKQINERINAIELLSSQKEQQEAENLSVRDHFLDSDHFYIDQYIEPLRLRTHEVEVLQKISEQNHVVEDEAAKKRLAYLLNQNKIAFTEGVVESYPYFTETTETLQKPVEVDAKDVEKLLALIEGVEIDGFEAGPNRPQLLITDFKLEKKNRSEAEAYLLNLKLLKREFF